MPKSTNVQQILSNKGDAIDEGLDSGLETSAPADPSPPDTSREGRIRLAAYAAAERRGFEPGFETEDWLEAERQVNGESQETSNPGGTP